MRGERAAEDADGLLGARNLGAPAGGVHVDCAELLIDLRRGDALGLHADRSSSTRISRLTPPVRLTIDTLRRPATAG